MNQILGCQKGYILPWAIMVSLLGSFIVLPIVLLTNNAFLAHKQIEDNTRRYYAADAAVHAVIEDLIRGADGAPIPPNTYTPPTVILGAEVASVAVQVLESKTLATVKPINYRVAGNPTVLLGVSPFGSGLDLAEDDDVYYKLSDAAATLSYEVTSEVIGFPTVSFGEVQIVALSTKSSTKLEVFIFNPNNPLHTQGGYNPIPDVTEILDLANTEETIAVNLEDAEVVYLNSLATKTLKIKIRATRTGGFRLDTDKVVFSMAGVVTTDQRDVAGQPVVNIGTLASGSAADLKRDDVSYYSVSSSSNVVEFEVTSENFAFTTIDLDTIHGLYTVRSNKDGVVIEMFVHNPTDPAHTVGGYNPVPDLTATIPLNNTDKAVTLVVPKADIIYLNTLFPISMKVKIRATHTTAFQLESDLLVFVATNKSAPVQVVKQITQQYFDPGLKNPALATMLPKEGYLLRIHNIHPGLLNVNWARHATDFANIQTTVLVFRGLVIDGAAVVAPGKITAKPPSQGNDLVVSKKSRPGEAFVQTGFLDVDVGIITIVFFNDSASTVITDAHAATGAKEETWVYVAAYKDYLINTQVDKVGLKAVVRQMPGPTEPPSFPWSITNINWIENLVSIHSWEPYGVE